MSFPMHIYTRAEWGAEPAKPRQDGNHPHEAFLHHTADRSSVVTFNQAAATVHRIQVGHMHRPDDPFSDIGYHFVIFQPTEKHPRGMVFQGRPVEYMPAAQLGHNPNTLAIAVQGDGGRDALQPHTRYLFEQLVRVYGPDVRAVGGHRDVVNTDCPGDRFYAALDHIADALNVRRV